MGIFASKLAAFAHAAAYMTSDSPHPSIRVASPSALPTMYVVAAYLGSVVVGETVK
jgi:hypothetical protein